MESLSKEEWDQKTIERQSEKIKVLTKKNDTKTGVIVLLVFVILFLFTNWPIKCYSIDKCEENIANGIIGVLNEYNFNDKLKDDIYYDIMEVIGDEIRGFDS